MKANIKSKAKAKVKDIKAKVKGKVKGKCKGGKCCAALALLLALCAGCMDTNPASRANDNRVGDIEPTVKVVIEQGAISNTVAVTMPITLGDGLIASADSAGSTETQTATPTLDIRTKIDARYNDALAAASTTSKGVIESLTEAGANKVLSLMADKSTGTVEVQKKDGTTATVECKDGQCSFRGSATTECTGDDCEYQTED